MRLIKNTFFILIAGIAISCGDKKASPLKIDMKPDTSFILPGNNEISCYEADIIGPRLLYARMDITWEGEGNFYPAIMKLSFRSPAVGGNFECTLSENITNLYQQVVNSVKTPVTVPYFVKGSYVLLDRCAIECGGINIANDKSFKVPGEIKLVGYSIDDEGNQTPYTARATIFLQNLD